MAPKKIDPRLLDPKYVFRDVNESVRSTDLFKNKKKVTFIVFIIVIVIVILICHVFCS